MKFWELTSSFREEPDILTQVLKQDRWRKYFKHYKEIDEIIRKQQRDILDEELPFDLCNEVAEKSKQEYWLSFDEHPQILFSYRPDIENLERLLPSEILVRFGGSKIEEAREHSYTNVQPKLLNGGIEVIGSYNLTSVGLLSILRSENNKLPDNSILTTVDGTKQWKVKGEYMQLIVDPYAAYEKLEAQKKQNIRHYLLDGMQHTDKPKPRSILKPIEHAG